MNEPGGSAGEPALVEVPIVVPRSARYVTLGGRPGHAPRELWVVLHGYGELARYFARPFRALASPSRVVLAPEALNRFYVDAPGRNHVEARVGATWMTREDREREIADQRGYLDQVVEHALARWPGAAPRLTVLGFSQGVATMARWAPVAARRPDHLVAWAGTFPAELDADAARALGGRVTVVGGEADAILSPDRLRADVARLAALGVHAELRWYAGGHAIDARLLAEIAGRE